MHPIARGGLACGVLDISAAFLTSWYFGGSPAGVLRFVARALIGPPALTGGPEILALGMLLHFTVAFGAATAYYLAARQIPALRRKPLIFGPIYGILVFFFMYYGVRRFTYVGLPHLTTQSFVIAVITHILCVGTPIALANRRIR